MSGSGQLRLAVASGKGGTGKTLLSTNLARLLGRQGRAVTYVDTDVEAPNGHLYLHPRWQEQVRHTVPVPSLPAGSCSGCGDCQAACAFNAIIALPKGVMLFPELCHGCGGCLLACPEDALVEVPREIGVVRRGQSEEVAVIDGVLDVGEAKAPPLIEGVLAAARGRELQVIDAPPGTSCSAVAVVRGADRVLLVTEPTPFGLHDLELAVAMCRQVGRPVAAVINRADLGDHGVRRWLAAEGIPLLSEIPYDPAIAEAYAQGELALDRSPGFRRALEEIARAAEEGF